MEVNTIDLATDPTATPRTATNRAKLSQKEFMQLLVAELTHQDPMNPMDNQQFVQQLASLQSLESSAALTDGIRDLVRVNELSSASALIGKRVRGVDADGEDVDGIVEKIRTEDGRVSLVVDGRGVPMQGVAEVLSPEDTE